MAADSDERTRLSSEQEEGTEDIPRFELGVSSDEEERRLSVRVSRS